MGLHRAIRRVAGACVVLQVASVVAANLQTVLIPMGATWKYLANGTDQGTAWRAPDFDDASWPEGPAELGYGEGDEATVVPSGNGGISKFVTTYFRTKFSVDRASRFASISGTLVYDDGAVIYLNGVEVYRLNMPAGPVGVNTLADDSVDYLPKTFTIDTRQLRDGVNVIAVEMHQGDSGSSDISFDLRLEGEPAR